MYSFIIKLCKLRVQDYVQYINYANGLWILKLYSPLSLVNSVKSSDTTAAAVVYSTTLKVIMIVVVITFV